MGFANTVYSCAQQLQIHQLLTMRRAGASCSASVSSPRPGPMASCAQRSSGVCSPAAISLGGVQTGVQLREVAGPFCGVVWMGASCCPPHLLCPWQLTLGYCAWRCPGGSEPVFSGGLSSPAAAVQGPPPGVLREPACSRASAVWGWAGAWFMVRSLPPVALVLGGGGLGTPQVVLLLVLLPAWLRRV